MRRRRQTLQVSTFPFLAVLLCAMGSLILLLLVLDRRARVVAQAKTREAQTQAAAENEQAAAARRAELEQRRLALHALLVEQAYEVVRQVQAVQERTAATLKSLHAEQGRARELQDRVQSERMQLTQGQGALAECQAEAEHTAQITKASQVELSRLASFLDRLEQTLASLKAARQRQQQTYSLVPYRGRRGDNRRPQYVECTADGLVFHPDRMALRGLTVTAQEVRAEIERRIERQRAVVSAAGGKPDETPYLLMLVRPDGIATYYRLQAALRGLPFDFGYEFIEADWILDFPEEDGVPPPPSWMTASITNLPEKVATPAARLRPGVPGRTTGLTFGAAAGGSLTEGSPGLGEPVPARSRLDELADAAQASGGRPPDPPVPGGSHWSSTAEPRSSETDRGGFSTTAAAGPPTVARPSSGGTALPSSGASAANKDLELAPWNPGPQPAPLPPFSGSGGQRPEASSLAENPPPGTPALPFPVPAILPPPPGRDRAQPGESAAKAAPAASAGTQHAIPESDPASPNGPAASLSAPVAGPSASDPRRQAARPAPLRTGLPTTNRDWIIPIECTADAVVLPLTGERFATPALPPGQAGKNPLRDAVQQLIARRQATVRPGEPPYRPQVRFRVQHDGLRSYYRAYPALESLRVPMTRENVEPDQDSLRKQGPTPSP